MGVFVFGSAEYKMGHIHAIIVLDKLAADGHPIAHGDLLGGEIGIPDDGIDSVGFECLKGVLFTGEDPFEKSVKRHAYRHHLHQ